MEVATGCWHLVAVQPRPDSHAGIISAKGRSHLLEIPYEDLIQTDAAITRGTAAVAGQHAGRDDRINTAIATNS